MSLLSPPLYGYQDGKMKKLSCCRIMGVQRSASQNELVFLSLSVSLSEKFLPLLLPSLCMTIRAGRVARICWRFMPRWPKRRCKLLVQTMPPVDPTTFNCVMASVNTLSALPIFVWGLAWQFL